MRSVMVRIPIAEFSATMNAIAEWLDTNQYEPTRYKYDHKEDAVLVTVDFPAALAASTILQPSSVIRRTSRTRPCGVNRAFL